MDEELISDLDRHNLIYSPLIQSEVFLLKGEKSMGAIVSGVEAQSFAKVAKLSLDLKPGQVVIGKELASRFSFQKGDSLSLAFSRGNQTLSDLPLFKSYVIGNIVSHGIYEKDLRMIYLQQEELQSILSHQHKVNLLLYRFRDPLNIEEKTQSLSMDLSAQMEVTPYWKPFEGLLEAVQAEKISITIILQLIVVVAIFNMAAFMIYLSEKKAQDFFMLQAFGLSLQSLLKIWLAVMTISWLSACLLAKLFTQVFAYLLTSGGIVKIPSDIYVLNQLELILGKEDYLVVYGLSFIWIICLMAYGALKMRRESLLKAMRMEF